MKISEQGVNLIKRYEGFRAKAYQCSAGVWTIGYGSTSNVYPELTITEQQAGERLRNDIEHAELVVNLRVIVLLNQCQFDSLVSFVFNIGKTGFEKSEMLACLNAGDYLNAANQFLRWNKVGGNVVYGLVKRREEEKRMFEKETNI